MKKCAKCKIEKEEKKFSKRKVAKDGLHPYCKDCVSGIMKIYGENEAVKKRTREWKKNNQDRVKTHAKKSYEKHKEERVKKVQRYVEKNRETINERQRKYNLRMRDVINEKQRDFWSSIKGNIYANEYYHSNKIRFDIKIKARNKLRYAVRTGKIMKPKICEKCFDKAKLHGHHSDYNKPLEVLWVCNYCHKKIHKIGN